jgi:hypothetical protein
MYHQIDEVGLSIAHGNEKARLEAEIKELKELHTMQLAAVMTASIQNTESTVKYRIGRDSPYWTQAYADVCVAIDREMTHRAKVEELTVQRDEAKVDADFARHREAQLEKRLQALIEKEK